MMNEITCPVCGEEVEPRWMDDSFDHHFGVQREYHWECPLCEATLTVSHPERYNDEALWTQG